MATTLDPHPVTYALTQHIPLVGLRSKIAIPCAATTAQAYLLPKNAITQAIGDRLWRETTVIVSNRVVGGFGGSRRQRLSWFRIRIKRQEGLKRLGSWIAQEQASEGYP